MRVVIPWSCFLENQQIQSVAEVSLTTNQPVSAVRDRMRSQIGVDAAGMPVYGVMEENVSADAPTVTLNPMQIRTFEVTLTA